jgi:hypothetical protein
VYTGGGGLLVIPVFDEGGADEKTRQNDYGKGDHAADRHPATTSVAARRRARRLRVASKIGHAPGLRGVMRFSMVQVVQFTINIFQELKAMSADDARR